MTTALPPRPQCLDALATAQRIRLAGAAFRREVRELPRPEGLALLAAQLEARERPEAVDRLPVERFLTAPRRVGEIAAAKLIHRARIHRRTARGVNRQNPTLRVGDLTLRERSALAAALRALPGVPT